MPLTELPYTEPMQDKRRKIDPKDHEQIKRDYHELRSYQKTADLYAPTTTPTLEKKRPVPVL